MAVENLQSASAAAPVKGASTATSPAASPTPAAPAMSFEEMVAAELGDDAPAATVNPETLPDETEIPDDQDPSLTDDPDDSDAGDDPTPEEGDPADDAAHEDLPPEHFKKLPQWAQKRLGKQAETVKALREELATRPFGVLPTPASPLAHVDSLEDLQSQTNLAKQIRQWCKANPDGGLIGNLEVSAEDVAMKLAHAETVLEAAPDWQSRLHRRAEQKPWEGARRVCPELFTPGTEQNQFAEMALQMCPEIRTKLPNWEMFLAAAARSIAQVTEIEQGKAKYVRMELKDGKVVAPQKPATPIKPGTKPAPLAGQGPGTVRPATSAPVARAQGGKPDLSALQKRYAATRDSDDLAALVAAEMAA